MDFKIQNNVIHAYGDINEGDGVSFVSHFEQLEQVNNSITIKLHTYGGSVFDGNLIYDAIANSKSKVIIHIVGVAVSMGAVICLATNEVYMAENGYMMIHAPSIGSYGTAKDHNNTIKLLELIESNFINKLISKTGKNREYVIQWLNGDNWFDAEQALNENLIKGIIKSESNVTALFKPNATNNTEVYHKITTSLKSKIFNQNNMAFKTTLIQSLNLKNVNDNSSDTAVLNAITEKLNLSNSLKEMLGLDEEATEEQILQRVKELIELEEGSQEEQKQEADNLISNALRAGKITPNQKTYLSNLFASNFKEAKSFLDTLSPRNSIYSQLRNIDNTVKNKSEWTLEDYRKNDPKALAENPTLYQELVNKQFNNK